MLAKLASLIAVLTVLTLVLFPKLIPRLLRRLGRGVRHSYQVGRELATGEEEKESPLARYEAQAGELLAANLLSRFPAGPAEWQSRVDECGQQLIPCTRRHEIPYRFFVVEAPEPNAFAVPGGAILITRPLVELCGEDSGRLAGVLAHEIVHIDLRHSIRNLAAGAVLKTGARLLFFTRNALLGKIAGQMEALMRQGYRQDQEFEADRLGVRLARQAGFDPEGLLSLLRSLEALHIEERGPLAEVFQYFKSHPPIRERIRALERELR